MRKAVIMAGGEGSRLRPLTCDLPKPMARLCGRPVLEYIFDLLIAHGFSEAAITVHYLPNAITDAFEQGSYGDLSLTFAEEHCPLGTAGSVKNACTQEDDNILVISGDAMCDFDLSAAMRAHEERGADVTIVVKSVDDPREYGLVNLTTEGEVTGFIEKPAFGQAVCDQANTGVYILSKSAIDLIPTDRPFDFANDLFPLMLKQGKKLFGYRETGYWCDIGDLGSYVSCQKDMLTGQVRCDIDARADEEGNFFAGSRPAGEYTLHAPVYIGHAVTIESGVILEAGTVLDDGVTVEANSRVTGSVLLPRSRVGHDCTLTGALLCAGATVKPKGMLFEGCAIGSHAIIGTHSVVNAGVKVWPGKEIADDVTVNAHVKYNITSREMFDDSGVSGDICCEITPEFCTRLGAAVGSTGKHPRIGLGCSDSVAARVLKDAVSAGLQSVGKHVLDFGANYKALFDFSMTFCGLDLGVFITAGEPCTIQIVTSGGLPIPRSIERGIQSSLARGEFARCGLKQFGERADMSGIKTLYTGDLLHLALGGLEGTHCQIKSSNRMVEQMGMTILERLGCNTLKGPTAQVSDNGERVNLYDEDNGFLPYHRLLAICAMSEFEQGNDIAVRFDAPRILDSLAVGYHRTVYRYYDCPADASDEQARTLAAANLWSRDGVMMTVKLLDIQRRAGKSLAQLAARLPAFDMAVKQVKTGKNPASILRSLTNGVDGAITEGVVIQHHGGTVLLRPLKKGYGIKIFAEAVSSEMAMELCDDLSRKIEQATQQDT